MKKIFFFLLLVSFLVTNPYTEVGVSADSGKFVVILLDQLSLLEVSQFAGVELIDLFNQSAQALMNVRTDQGIDSDSVYQAFGAGNRGRRYGAVPGTLGQILKDHDLKIAAFGNKDYGTDEGRQVVTIVMDNNGHLFFGDVSRNTLVEDEDFPGGVRTDYQKLESLFIEGYPEYDVIVLEIGDIGRLKRGVRQKEISEDQFTLLMEQTLGSFDQLISRVGQTIDIEKDRLMVVAPTPSPLEVNHRSRLSWVLVSGGDEGIGVLTSGTTRRSGLVTISDLGPTILNFFGISTPMVMNGRYISTDRTRPGGLTFLLSRHEEIYRTSEWRPWYIKLFILIQIIALSLSTLTFLARKLVGGFLINAVSGTLLGVLWIPMFFLVLTPYDIPFFRDYLIAFVVFKSIATLVVLRIFKKPLSLILFIINLTVVLLVLDIFRGSPWMSRSILGYCPIIGARFYGIGNEFMGILIGGALVGWTGLLDHFTWLKVRKLWLTPLVFSGLIFVIGFPRLGANFGGTLTAMAAFTFTYVMMFKKKVRVKILLISTLILVLFLGLIITADAYGWLGGRSHFGQTVQLLRENGITALQQIVARKLSMNLKLLRWTIWTRVLLTFIIVLIVLFIRPRGILLKLVQEFPHLSRGLAGVILGTMVTMAVNDSGVVAAATLLFFAVLPLVYLVLRRM